VGRFVNRLFTAVDVSARPPTRQTGLQTKPVSARIKAKPARQPKERKACA